MPDYNLVLAPRAKADLTDIYAYTRQSWGVAQADSYLGALEEAFARLCENPEIGKARPDIREGYRCLNVEKHLIFYKINNLEIHILGVLHARMDIINHSF
jgi:toxin ParE1/3/4